MEVDMGLFGSNKCYDVRLTAKQAKELMKSMSGKELRQFKAQQKDLKRAQKRREDDAFWDGLIWGTLIDD